MSKEREVDRKRDGNGAGMKDEKKRIKILSTDYVVFESACGIDHRYIPNKRNRNVGQFIPERGRLECDGVEIRRRPLHGETCLFVFPS